MKFKFKTVAKNKENACYEIKTGEYSTKKEFLQDLESQGYQASPYKIKVAAVHDAIMEYTNGDLEAFKKCATVQDAKNFEKEKEKEIQKQIANRWSCEHDFMSEQIIDELKERKNVTLINNKYTIVLQYVVRSIFSVVVINHDDVNVNHRLADYSEFKSFLSEFSGSYLRNTNIDNNSITYYIYD